ncbi:MAG: PilT/PilU family type 4a pilus ATPase [Planctomycetes bacterium]|nr:PilT/PilU family type 4a pilus ATPase [Planctomycetota bacterium]
MQIRWGGWNRKRPDLASTPKEPITLAHTSAAPALGGLERLFVQLVRCNGSDLFVQVDAPPSIRIDGHVRILADGPTTADQAQELFAAILNEHQQEAFTRGGEVDAAVVIAGVGRFRANVFSHRGLLGFVFRHLKAKLPELSELLLPAEQIIRLAQMRRGLVIVTGTAGSGKSTTLAGIVHWLNRNQARHIVTLEDPVEFLFEGKLCTIHQREVGVDTVSFATALKHIVRQSPDVIIVGEMRDRETVEAAIRAAETGHLVLSTLHTVNASQTVERILSFFPSEQHALVRSQLSMLLEGVISQRLLQRDGSGGRVLAVELLLATPTIREMLAQGRTGELRGAIREGAEHFGTMTFNQSLAGLVRENLISETEAIAASDSPDEIKLELRGITKGGRGRAVFGGGFQRA